MEAFNLSEYFNTTQSGVEAEYSYNDMNSDHALKQGTFDNGTQDQEIADTYTAINNEFIDKFVSYSNLILGIFGALGHILSLIILLRQPFKEMPHSVICASLALVDLVFMLLNVNLALVRIVTGNRLMLMNRYLCKFIYSSTQLFLHLDAWILVGLGAERVVAVFYPLHAKMVITKFRIKVLLMIMFLFFLILDGETSIRFDLAEITKGGNIIHECHSVYFYGLPQKCFLFKDQITMFLGHPLPFAIMAICNVAILIKLAKQKRQQANLGVTGNDSQNARINAMLIGVMLAYVLLNFPIHIYVVTVLQPKNKTEDEIFKIFSILSTLNFAINFYLYFFTSALFRKTVKTVFKFKCIERGKAVRVSKTRAQLVQQLSMSSEDRVSNTRGQLVQQPSTSSDDRVSKTRGQLVQQPSTSSDLQPFK